MAFNMFDSVSSRAVTHRRPDPGTRTGRVWEIADEITREKGRRAKRREVIERYVAERGNRNTAGTQYQYWKNDHDAPRRGPVPASSEARRTVGPRSLKISPDGRILIPVDMREAIGLGDEGRVTARIEAGELRLVSPALAVRQIQSRMRKYKKSGESIVDCFLADRRAMWGEG